MSTGASFENFERELIRLVDIFTRNLSAYKGPGYDEESLRHEFLNPFFAALGWDMENKAGLIPSHREVIVERRTGTGRADFLFQPGRKPRFVCEAKRPAEELASHARQAKRYAWIIGIHLSVLSDFEETHFYIANGNPDKDKPEAGLWLAFHFTEYATRARELWDLLARDNVADGCIERAVAALPKKLLPRKKPFDDEFLAFLDGHRRALGSDLIRNNDRADLLEGTKLNEAVQCILDRLLFIRISEARGIDMGTRLQSLLATWESRQKSGGGVMQDTPPAGWGGEGLAAPRGSLWNSIVKHIRGLDRRPPSHVPYFNGNLFKHHFSEELVVGDVWLSEFLKSISEETSSYTFGHVAVEILGTIYERFLGKVVRPQGTGTTIVEKPEVRKAGGVYYTPRYIVEYIVEQTVGKMLEGRKPEDTLKLRFLDPACGSGSFLLRVFERVCEHWQQWLVDNPTRRKKDWCWLDEKTNTLQLTIRAKRRILRETVFGVDLDAQAVEVTQLSLYLKLLEGETAETLHREQDLFGSEEAILPPLQDNIKCGNSLIASDFLDGELMTDELVDKLKDLRAFDWPVQFAPIMKAGGFDAVVGNPPYVLLQTLDERPVFEYLGANYRSARYKIDTYQVFMERALNLTRAGGGFGFITPNSFLRNKHAVELRSLVLERTNVSSLRIFFYPVFDGASVDTCILIARRAEKPDARNTIEVVRSESPDKSSSISIPQQKWAAHPQKNFYLPGAGLTDAVLDTIRSRSFPLGEIATAYFGIQTFDRTRYVTTKKQLKAHKPVVDGGHIRRCDLLAGTEFVDFRPDSIKSGGNPAVYEAERIGVRQIGRTPIATLIPAGIYSLNTIYNIFFTKPTDLQLKFILGLFLSSTCRWFWLHQFYDQKETFPKVKKDSLLAIPVPRLNFSKPADKARHDKLVLLVDKLLGLMPRLRAATVPAEKATLQNAVTATDQQIDALVYELYGLTDDEIKLVEGAQ